MFPGLLPILLVAAAAAPVHQPPSSHRREVIHRIVIDGKPALATEAAASTAPPSTNASGGPEQQAGAPSPTQQREHAGQAQAAQLAAQVDALDADVAQLQTLLALERQRTAALERQVAEEQARWRLQVEEPVRRTQALSAQYRDLAAIDQALAAGSIGVGPAIAQAQATVAAAARSAGAGGWEVEANVSAGAAQFLAASHEAMQRSDLYQARVALDAAARQAWFAGGLAAATAEQSGARY